MLEVPKREGLGMSLYGHDNESMFKNKVKED